MKKKIAMLFPGQGAQYPGMGKDFAEHFAAARETFEEADDLLKEPLSQIIFEGPENRLTQTKNSQLGIFVTSAAILRVLQSQTSALEPALCSGLSLGEYTALWASKRLSFQETLLLVRERARLMNEACLQRSGTMAAVLGLDAKTLEGAIGAISGVWIANYNCPGQIVISGTKEGVEKASIALKETGAKRVLPLQVSGAFHSGLMQNAEDALKPFIAKANITSSEVGFVMNVPGDFTSDVSAIRDNLAAQVTHSVRWEQGIYAIERASVDLYLEIGCGKTLSGLNRKIGVKRQTVSLEKIEELNGAVLKIEESVCNC